MRLSQIKELEEEKRQLDQSVLELKAKCEAIEKRESERRAMEERKHAEEIAFLKKTNVQLKVRRVFPVLPPFISEFLTLFFLY